MTIRKAVGWLLEAITMFVVAAASLFLLLYVGYGDGKRTYESIHIEKLTAQAAYVQASMEKYLRDGVPLKQYVGFSTLAAPILEGEDVDAIAIYDQQGRQVFTAMIKQEAAAAGAAGFRPSTYEESTKVHYDPTHYQVVMPLAVTFRNGRQRRRRRPEQPCYPEIVRHVPAAGASGDRPCRRFFDHRGYRLRRGSPNPKKPWLQIVYGVTFLTMAVVVVGTLIGLYFDGVEGKAKASAFTLSAAAERHCPVQTGHQGYRRHHRALRRISQAQSGDERSGHLDR